MRVTLAAIAGAALLSGCQMPRPVLQSIYDECPKIVGTPPPTGSLLFITMRQPNCSGQSAVTKLTDRRTRTALYAGSKNGAFDFFTEDQWLSALDSESPNKSKPLILYVHGYRNTNADALTVAQKIRSAVRDSGPVVAVTWPSYARYTSYYWDETNAEWASTGASRAVLQIANRFPHVVIVAHSMGNRIALAILSELRTHGLASHVDHLIMASPDVDRSSLREAIAAGLGTRVTIYGSRRDQALSASWRAHSYPRGGDLSWWVTGHDRDYSLAWLSGTEVIDTTDVDHSVSGHSAFIETRQGAEDLCRVVHGAGSNRPGIQPLSVRVPHAPDNYFRLVEAAVVDDCTQGNR